LADAVLISCRLTVKAEAARSKAVERINAATGMEIL